jgi:hypothetical protein
MCRFPSRREDYFLKSKNLHPSSVDYELICTIDSMFRDVASIVVEKSINPENNRPYTVMRT